MTQQTAVEWLQDNCFETYLDGKIYCNGKEITFEVEQAKQMEKEQIMMAVKDSWYMAKGSNFQEPQEEEYYNETYKQ